jgi:small nuclear ribonucleoprotein (snRNP)-like protein
MSSTIIKQFVDMQIAVQAVDGEITRGTLLGCDDQFIVVYTGDTVIFPISAIVCLAPKSDEPI